jgi:hypothetical protein
MPNNGPHQQQQARALPSWNNKDLQRARIKGELRPLLSLAIQAFLTDKQQQLLKESKTNQPDYLENVHLLARWNGYELIDPSRIVMVPGGDCNEGNNNQTTGRLTLGQGLVAEASPFASENYIVLARRCQQQPSEKRNPYPPFVQEDASWYNYLEDRINDNLNLWEERARQRRQHGFDSAKEGLQRLLDSVFRVPATKLFETVTIRLGPVVENVRSTLRRSLKQLPTPTSTSTRVSTESGMASTEGEAEKQQIANGTHRGDASSQWPQEWNETDPEDLIILTKDGSLLLLSDVQPKDRLLSLPVVNTISLDGRAAGKSKPPYRLRLARGGLVITVSFIMLGAVAPTYRSLRFILDYPRALEVVMITLVGSMAYSLWSWISQTKMRQRELIAAAIQARFVARDKAALAYLTIGAVDRLTEVVMEDYAVRLLSDAEESNELKIDPLVAEIGCSVGLLRKPIGRVVTGMHIDLSAASDENGNGIVAVEWEKAREELLHVLAKRR